MPAAVMSVMSGLQGWNSQLGGTDIIKPGIAVRCRLMTQSTAADQPNRMGLQVSAPTPY
jgi:hypothetical protein